MKIVLRVANGVGVQEKLFKLGYIWFGTGKQQVGNLEMLGLQVWDDMSITYGDNHGFEMSATDFLSSKIKVYDIYSNGDYRCYLDADGEECYLEEAFSELNFAGFGFRNPLNGKLEVYGQTVVWWIDGHFCVKGGSGRLCQADCVVLSE